MSPHDNRTHLTSLHHALTAGPPLPDVLSIGECRLGVVALDGLTLRPDALLTVAAELAGVDLPALLHALTRLAATAAPGRTPPRHRAAPARRSRPATHRLARYPTPSRTSTLRDPTPRLLGFRAFWRRARLLCSPIS